MITSEDYFYDLPEDNVLETKASLFKRFIALLIDLLIFNIVFYPVFMQSFQLTSGFRDELLTPDYLSLHPELLNVMLGVLVSGSVIFCFYMSLSEYNFKKTIGKHFMGLSIKGEASISGFVVRNLLKSTFIFLLPIDLIGIALTGDRFIDRFLGVKVLYNKNLSFIGGRLF